MHIYIYIYIYVFTFTYISLSISLSTYIYIYIYSTFPYYSVPYLAEDPANPTVGFGDPLREDKQTDI